MKCPIDNVDLQMAERQGIEIDYCPVCRGVWLDRGELDKLIDRGGAAMGTSPRQQKSYRDDDDTRYSPHRKHRREGFLGEIFDF